MVCEWGMGTEMYYEPKQPAAEAEINRMLKDVLARAVALLEQRSPGVEKIEQALLERETLTGEEVRRLLEPQVPLAPAIIGSRVDENSSGCDPIVPHPFAHGIGMG
jgi:ATP-dependent Zn protease